VKSLGGSSYFVTFIYDSYRKVWNFTMKCIDKVLKIFQKNYVMVERPTSKPLIAFNTGLVGEYISNRFEEYCAKYGIIHEKDCSI